MTDEINGKSGKLPEVIKRRKGGQPGNQNARTHGFYSKVLSPEDRKVLEEAAGLHGLDQEIALLRMKILSILAEEPQNHFVLLMAVTALTRLLKARQAMLKDDPQALEEKLEHALKMAAGAVGIESLIGIGNGTYRPPRSEFAPPLEQPSLEAGDDGEGEGKSYR